MEPDLDGLQKAQERLIDKLGQSVVLLRPIQKTYPGGTKMDPETGRPMDPWVQPTNSGGMASATVQASVAFRPLSGVEARDVEGPLGIKGSNGVALILKTDSWPLASGATQALVGDKLYQVEDRVRDFRPDRYIVFLEPR